MENQDKHGSANLGHTTGAMEAQQVMFRFILHALLQTYFNLLSKKITGTIKVNI